MQWKVASNQGSLTGPSGVLLNQLKQLVDIIGAAQKDWAPLVDVSRLKVEDTF